jgi:hypothetical protein
MVMRFNRENMDGIKAAWKKMRDAARHLAVVDEVFGTVEGNAPLDDDDNDEIDTQEDWINAVEALATAHAEWKASVRSDALLEIGKTE